MQTTNTQVDASHKQVHGRITTLARIAEIAAIVGFILLVGAQVYYGYLVITGSAETDALIRDSFGEDAAALTITPLTRILTYLINLAPVIVGLFGLCAAQQLFYGYRQGRIFTSDAANRLTNVGWAVFLLAPFYIVANTASVLVLTMYSGPGQHRLSLSFDEGDIFALVFGLLIVVVGRILHEAALISEENKSFV